MTSPLVEISSGVEASTPAASNRGRSKTRARLLPLVVSFLIMEESPLPLGTHRVPSTYVPRNRPGRSKIWLWRRGSEGLKSLETLRRPWRDAPHSQRLFLPPDFRAIGVALAFPDRHLRLETFEGGSARFVGRGAMGGGDGDRHARFSHRHVAQPVDDRGA